MHALTRDELMQRFGGLTAYTRAPVSGLWQPGQGEAVHDELLIFEVMADRLDRVWWAGYRDTLERRFRQQQVLVRAHEVSLL